MVENFRKNLSNTSQPICCVFYNEKNLQYMDLEEAIQNFNAQGVYEFNLT